MENFQKLFSFYKAIEKLKTTYRHSSTSDKNRKESVADHSWMSCVIAITLINKINIKLDQLKILKMILIHDLPELVTGDIPAWENKEKKESSTFIF